MIQEIQIVYLDGVPHAWDGEDLVPVMAGGVDPFIVGGGLAGLGALGGGLAGMFGASSAAKKTADAIRAATAEQRRQYP